MSAVLETIRTDAIVLRLRPVIDMTDDQLFDVCQLNRELRIERTAQGELIVMPPAGSETSRRNLNIGTMLDTWSTRDGTGVAFDSSGGFRLPSGAMRSPDAAWASRARLARLEPSRKDRFLALCPDFVIELRSSSDSLPVLEAKMEEWMANGARLGWLIDPLEKRAHVYRPGQRPEILEEPARLDGGDVLPGFVLALTGIWANVL